MTDNGPALLAIDSGQTAIKVRGSDGFEHSFPGVRTNTGVLPQLAEAIRASVQLAGHPYREVAIGTSGLGEDESDPAALLRATAALGIGRVLLAHDSITSYLGAVGLRQGVVVAAGTGVVTLGVGWRRISRVDGWGNIIGDAGSGYWIGRRALDAVMRAYDGRGPATALTDVVRGRFPDLDKAYIQLQTDPDRVRLIARYARPVAALAETDAVACAICLDAGAELALSGATAARTIAEPGDAGPPLIALIGGLFSASAVRESCVANLRLSWPDFEPFEAIGDGLDGAQALPDVSLDSPLATRIAAAG